MQISSERLTKARLDAGYEKLVHAVRAFGWKEGAYRTHESGARSFDVDTALAYARAFKVSPIWLLGLDRYADPGAAHDLAVPRLDAEGCAIIVEELLLPLLVPRSARQPAPAILRATAGTLADVLAALREDPAALDDPALIRQTARTARTLTLGSLSRDD